MRREARCPIWMPIRLSIQQNRTMEMVRFERGELHLINSVAPDNFDKLAGRIPIGGQ